MPDMSSCCDDRPSRWRRRVYLLIALVVVLIVVGAELFR